ncbi:NADPH-dependent FMN reductase [Amycolatopsis jejuensis]|uniref:NADPH-dependent FMN reductase n=1 Tax=Amycolatopsis jejuensis TaxID=330084 RepID=UPI0005270B59|nr:NAD(P)H-dependent oxidoreductase [Amycolatopsis jejuensis]
MNPRIALVIGTTRTGRKGADIAAWAHRIANSRDDAEFTVVDLAEYDLPLYDDPMPPMRRAVMPPAVQRWADAISPHDGYLFVTAEYNHGIPAALKNGIDQLFDEWSGKAAGFVSYGVDGGIRAVEQLRQVLAALRVATVSATTPIRLFTDLDEHGKPGAQQEAQLQETLAQLVSWSRALADGK